MPRAATSLGPPLVQASELLNYSGFPALRVPPLNAATAEGNAKTSAYGPSNGPLRGIFIVDFCAQRLSFRQNFSVDSSALSPIAQ
jgi:hypothetical protein